MADLEAVLADVSYLMAMEKSKSTPAARASKKIVLPDPSYVATVEISSITSVQEQKAVNSKAVSFIMFSVFSVYHVIYKYLKERGEVNFDTIFDQKLGEFVHLPGSPLGANSPCGIHHGCWRYCLSWVAFNTKEFILRCARFLLLLPPRLPEFQRILREAVRRASATACFLRGRKLVFAEPPLFTVWQITTSEQKLCSPVIYVAVAGFLGGVLSRRLSSYLVATIGMERWKTSPRGAEMHGTA